MVFMKEALCSTPTVAEKIHIRALDETEEVLGMSEFRIQVRSTKLYVMNSKIYLFYSMHTSC